MPFVPSSHALAAFAAMPGAPFVAMPLLLVGKRILRLFPAEPRRGSQAPSSPWRRHLRRDPQGS